MPASFPMLDVELRTGGAKHHLRFGGDVQLVLEQLQLEQPQQLEVLHELQLEVLVLELHQPAASWAR